MTSFYHSVKRAYTSFFPPSAAKDSNCLKIGILSTGDLSNMAMIAPAKSHPGVEVYAVASRDENKAKAFAKKNGISKVYSGAAAYQELLNDPQLDAVYIPLPNNKHYEWTIKALDAGKHVLVEKPIASTPEEAREMHELAERRNLVLLEAMHVRFHPALQRVRKIIQSGELGPLKHMSATTHAPIRRVNKDYLPEDFGQAKGSLMDIGCYNNEVFRFISSSDPIGVGTSTFTPSVKASNMDKISHGILEFPGNVTGTFSTNSFTPNLLGFIPQFEFSMIAECEGGTIKLSNYMLPQLYHSITVTKSTGEKRVEKAYVPEPTSATKGEEWWSTYRHQLEAFVKKIKGEEPHEWYTKEDSIVELTWLQKTYEKLGLDPRPASKYYLQTHSVQT